MLFNSFAFLVFFPTVTLLFFLLPHKLRWALLLAASCFFYMFFKPEYILILGFTIVVDYFAGLLLDREQRPKVRKLYLVFSLIANIGVLSVFKYYNFIDHNLFIIGGHLGIHEQLPLMNMVLPIGLSFHTFQAMSYTIEIYRGNQKAEKSFGIYALYVMFYPQLVAGPIERPQNMLHQFHERKYFKYNNVVSGLRSMLWGLFKKVVIADRLAMITDPVFNNPHNASATTLLIASILFSFQIYCDFSGYTDIAIGAAQVMGFKLMKNFNHPYKAQSIAEFWRDWHISLSTWFRDYIYIPLGGNRCSKARMYFNILCVFILSGLWHGANWTFIVWGLLHGCYIIFGDMTKKVRIRFLSLIGLDKLYWVNTILQQVITFVLVTLAWILFRANSIWDAVYIFRKLPQAATELKNSLVTGIRFFNINFSQFLFSCGLILLLLVAQHVEGSITMSEYIGRQSGIKRWGIYYFLALSIIFLGIFQNKQFIYFQF